ncbi:hypothetical protein [Sphingomonas elodea]|uniref:hypothetical protein n=1 Tax=Sphingomonas elodea TaxID=179878 RepID=UPI0002631302|nr:hypothetical protein [Sphingomonas elodea]
MRAILGLLGVLVLIAVVLIALGFLNVDVRGGKLPTVAAETGKVAVGESNSTVRVPTVEMKEKQVKLPTIDVQKAPEPTPSPAQ